MSFKERKLDITPMEVVNVNMQSALAIDQSQLFVNNSMVDRNNI